MGGAQSFSLKFQIFDMFHFIVLATTVIVSLLSDVGAAAAAPVNTKQLKDIQRDLLNGVQEFSITNPGYIVLFGAEILPILHGSQKFQTVAAVAEYGPKKARIFIATREAFLYNFGIGDPGKPGLKTFQENVKTWLSRGNTQSVSVQYVKDLTAASIAALDAKASILTVPNSRWISPQVTRSIENFLRRGGSLAFAQNMWYWNSYRKFTDMPLYTIIRKLGIISGPYMTDGTINARTSVPALAESHFGHIVNLISLGGEVADSAVAACSWVLQRMTDAELEVLMDTYLSALDRTIPATLKLPLTHTASQRKQIRLYDQLLNRKMFSNTKVPGVTDHPGDFSSPPPKLTVTVDVNTGFYGAHYPIGYYVAAGDTMRLTVISSSKSVDSASWWIRVGSHVDNNWKRTTYKRWPAANSVYADIKHTNVEMFTPYGGLVYMVSTSGQSGNITVKLENVVQAPFFDLMDDDTIADWSNRRNAPGFWADLCGQFIRFTVPSSMVRDLKDPKSLMEFYDTTMVYFHYLRATSNDVYTHRPEWWSFDKQISAGWMHSGYPIGAPTAAAPGFLDKANMEGAADTWGYYHEVGHNLQKRVWTPNGYGEVTNNIFALYQQDVISIATLQSQLKDWMLPQLTSYLNDDSKQWTPHAGSWVKLAYYNQLARYFGWGCFRETFKKYEQLARADQPRSNQNKLDRWSEFFSDVSQHNVLPMYDFYKVPISDALRYKIASKAYPAFLPNDSITAISPKRVKLVCSRYSDLIRTPRTIPVYEYRLPYNYAELNIDKRAPFVSVNNVKTQRY